MIIDLKKFVAAEEPYWKELEEVLKKLEQDPGYKLDLKTLTRFHYLYERASAGLGKLMTFAIAPEVRAYLERLVARAYGEVHELNEGGKRFSFSYWKRFPQTFRRHLRFFMASSFIVLAGMVLGGILLAVNPENKRVLLPFDHLHGTPGERVANEESGEKNPIEGRHAEFSSELMTHNTRVAILTLALGMTFGFGTVVSLFYNGVILGAVVLDYLFAGQHMFLMGWLMPHGIIEIPAILIAGQGGLLLASTLIGKNQRFSLRNRLKKASPDLVALIFGVAGMLIWAGIIEAFLSQYHAPVLPYWVKILFGLFEGALLVTFLAFAGRDRKTS